MSAKRLHVAPGFTLPLDAITTATGTFGIRGSGKTNTNVVMVEEFLEQQLQVVILDPTDAWWGLKSSKDGKKAGYPVIVMGGRHADLPLGGGDGTTIADFVVDTGASVILSLRHFETDAEKRRLVIDFCRRLYFRKGQQDAPTPIMVVIDEASIIVPQTVKGDDSHMVSAVQRLVRQGRSSGIGVNLIDARPATVNKDVLAGIEMLVTHRVTSPKDRKALREYVEQHDPDGRAVAFLEELAALPQGVAWFWSPGWIDVFEKAHVRERRTFDSSRTPKAGEVAIVPTKMADIDLEAIKAKLGQSIERAKAEDPKELKKKIVELETEVRRARASQAPADKAALERGFTETLNRRVASERASVEKELRAAFKERETLLESAMKFVIKVSAADFDVAGIDRGELEKAIAAAVERATASIDKQLDARVKEIVQLRREAETLLAKLRADRQVTVAVSVTKQEPYRVAPQASPPRRATPVAASTGNGTLTGARLKIARALAELEAIGETKPTKKQLSFYCGLSFAGGYGSNTLGAMRTEGLIDYPSDGRVALTDAGRAAAGDVDPPNSLNELHARVRSHLSGLEERIFDAVISVGKHGALTKEQLSEAVGASFAGGYGSNTLGALRTAGLIEYPGKGSVAPSDLLFPDGL